MAQQAEFEIDELICALLSAGLVALIVKPLSDVDMMAWWWWPFMLCNVCYILYGMKKGWAKGDPANGLVICTGPIAFYFWTFLYVWRKYGKRTLLKRENSKQRKEAYEEKVTPSS